jgi:hypothetical protein
MVRGHQHALRRAPAQAHRPAQQQRRRAAGHVRRGHVPDELRARRGRGAPHPKEMGCIPVKGKSRVRACAHSYFQFCSCVIVCFPYSKLRY